ncbi:hypothetical protein, partial [Micromonospora sp. KC213]|uniref:hypothetical protein n=1 Tax=Micromonospora sp. KC213 TaxID=2530378 RepID=UPI001A9E1793
GGAAKGVGCTTRRPFSVATGSPDPGDRPHPARPAPGDPVGFAFDLVDRGKPPPIAFTGDNGKDLRP